MRKRFSGPGQQVGSRPYFLLIAISTILFFLVQPGMSFGAGRGLTLTTTVDNSYANSNVSEERYLEVLVQASERSRRVKRQRPPLNIALVLDRSGSMQDDRKLHSAIEAVWAVVQKLRPEDHFSLVTYNGHVEVPVQAGSGQSKYQTRFLLDRIQAQGSTNLSGGLLEGYRQVERYYSPQRINRVMLFSDGRITQGIRSSSQLNDIVMDYADAGISLTTFGMGYDFNENLMASLSESGRGMYYFVDGESDMGDMLAREFHNAEMLVAQNIRVEVRIDSSLTIDEVFANKYEQRGNMIILHGGDLAAGELRRFQIRVRTKVCRPGKQQMAKVHMTYVPAGQDRQVSKKDRVTLNYKQKHVGRYRNKDVSERTSVFKAHYARSRAAEAVDRGDMQQAKKILAKAEQDLRQSGVKTKKVREQQKEVEAYTASLQKKMSRKDRARIQKAVKYDRHTVEGC